jgi:hypothetical protein
MIPMCPREPLLAKGGGSSVQLISYLELVVLMATAGGHHRDVEAEGELMMDGASGHQEAGGSELLAAAEGQQQRDAEQEGEGMVAASRGEGEGGSRIDLNTPSTQERSLCFSSSAKRIPTPCQPDI